VRREVQRAGQQDLVYGVFGMGLLFHVLYATANDVRYYQPAHDLYTATVGLLMDDAKRAEAQKNMASSKRRSRNTKAGTGTHDKGAIGSLLNRHNQEVQACYEAQLAATQARRHGHGHLDADATGAIKAWRPSPRPASPIFRGRGCVVEAAKTWKLPKRGMPGTTRIKLVYTMAPRSSARIAHGSASGASAGPATSRRRAAAPAAQARAGDAARCARAPPSSARRMRRGGLIRIGVEAGRQRAGVTNRRSAWKQPLGSPSWCSATARFQ